jgi:hypothetical protein
VTTSALEPSVVGLSVLFAESFRPSLRPGLGALGLETECGDVGATLAVEFSNSFGDGKFGDHGPHYRPGERAGSSPSGSSYRADFS